MQDLDYIGNIIQFFIRQQLKKEEHVKHTSVLQNMSFKNKSVIVEILY